MKYLNAECYVELKSLRYNIHPNEKIVLQKGDPPKTLRTKYQI